jgi:hypothetical protein
MPNWHVKLEITNCDIKLMRQTIYKLMEPPAKEHKKIGF